ncbi:DUF3307 domain-containing protein [Sphingobacterium paucimobilis]|uniref:DUF3307 domain-containing protein n=1 Tax=Sphingobacterium paucimobilis HER1398 TaxID=1346330 RepID=U2J1B2_9SPHI|nr:DUF3307 domain-containing protein [Sphingobacterium paucimobilis]ERJ58754.1 hypothetical protein M472_08230 [Sphingobacterium paucimobilis HER1398]
MLTLFLKLLLAHLLGDFVLQPRSWVIKRRDNVFYLLLHVLVHVLLLTAVLYPSWPQYGLLILGIGCAHLAIDSLKIWWEKLWPYKPVFLFALDQFLHLAVLITATFYCFGVPPGLWEHLLSDQAIVCVIAFLLIAVVSPIFLRVFFSKWNQENELNDQRKGTLIDAGMLIGIMERLIIVLFIQVGFLSGIGFLLAAKSIFRFGDLKNAKDTKFTEYVLVGTLSSFTIAIIVGYLLRLALRYIS